MKLKHIAALAALTVPMAAQATDGYFTHGYGMKAKGMGGASIAVAGQDAFGGANNPALMALAGNRFEVGIDLFSPWRKAERTGGAAFGLDGSADSDSNYFGVPEMAFNYMVRPNLALGVTVYGNGGMNTDYTGGQLSSPVCAAFNPNPGPYNLLCGNGSLGVDLSQLIIAPTIAWQFVPNHSVGLSPLFAYQRFSADGLQAFDNPFASTSPGNVTNRGHDSSTGWGARIGYYGQFTPQLGVGAQYTTKMSMGELDKYKGLFAEQGGFDIPSHWGIGVGIRPTPQWLIALDYERINYSDVKSVNNPSANIITCLTAGTAANCMGGSNGAGFGWQSVNVFKLGAQYALNANWTLRAGYNYSDNPIKSQDVTFNIMAPGVIQNHLTAGATYAWANRHEITGAFMYAFTNDVTGPSLFNSLVPGLNAQEKIEMYQWSLGVQYSYKF
jgi:long-chain fatty acid transport protein